jgi:hypothetical protein
MKKLAAEVARVIRFTPGWVLCSNKVMQMCGKCLGKISHKLPLREEQLILHEESTKIPT